MSIELRGAGPAGRYLVGEGVLTAIGGVVVAIIGVVRMSSYTTAADDSGVGALVIVLFFVTALLLGAVAAGQIAAGRAVRRGSHGAWRAAIALSALQVLAALLIWPLAIPLGVLGAVGLVLLVLPETRAECAAAPVTEEAEAPDAGL